jgi:PAS domain S-box-containing protein
MRITTRLRIISTCTIAALVVLVPILIKSFVEFKEAKNDYILANAIKVNFFERASFRDQYFLFREERAREQWDKSKETADRLLHQANTQFHGEEDRQALERLRRNIEDTAVIFHRIVYNTEAFNSSAGNRQVYEELDKRLFSQLLLKAAAVRDTSTALQDASARRVEQTYQHLTIIISLFAATLALATIMTSMQIGRLIRKRLAPLHDGARIVAGGNLDYRLQCDGTDEFAELALSINAMTGKLEEEISTHKQAAEMLRKLSIAVEQSPASVIITDLDTCIQYVNPRFTEVTGYSAAEVIGQNPRILQSGQTPKEIYRDLWSKLNSGLAWHGELLNKRKNGELYWEETHVAPVKNSVGAVTHYVAVKTDITERKQAETRLQELNDTLSQWVEEAVAKNMMQERMLIQQSRLAALGEMIHNIAHQWRQPINSLTLILANLKDAYEYNDLTKEYLDEEVRIGQELIQKMSATIDDFRNFFKPDKKQQIFLVHESVEEAIKLISESLTSCNIKIVEENSADPCMVVGYPNELAQVALNALTNAKEAILDNNIAGEIHIKVENGTDWATVSIRNNGDGIPEEILPKVFDPYFTTKEKGSGIGLYMSKMIMNNMDGDIAIRNVEGGVEVLLTLPLTMDAAV